jgi:hypothetical protein
MTKASISKHSIQKYRDWIARILLIFAALGAMFAFVSAIASVQSATPTAFVAEVWRMYGFLVFAGLFTLLAVGLRHMTGVWELVIFHKAATAITVAFSIGSAVPEAATITVIDGVLAVMTLAAYFLARGFAAWSTLKPDRSL